MWSTNRRARQSRALKAFWAGTSRAYRRRRMRRVTEGQTWDMAHREAQAERCRRNSKRLWEDPKYREEQLSALRGGLRRRWRSRRSRRVQSQLMEQQLQEWRRSGKLTAKPSKPQRCLLAKLNKAGIKGFRLEVAVGRYSLDVANRKLKICAELDGEYWHRVNPTDYRRRDRFLRRLGWEVRRFSSSKGGVFGAFHWIKKLSS